MNRYATLTKDSNFVTIFVANDKIICIKWGKSIKSDISIEVSTMKPILYVNLLTEMGYSRSADELPNFDLNRKISEAKDVIDSFINNDDSIKYLSMQKAEHKSGIEKSSTNMFNSRVVR